METLECIETRRSIRKFRDTPVEFEKVGNILNAAKNAPSSGNLQDWKFILVTEKEKRDEIAKACLEQYWMATAPVFIVVCSQPDRTKRFYGERGEERYSFMNGAMAVENMLLAAHDQGLGSCCVGAFEDDMLRRALDIPDDINPLAVLPIGYPAEKVAKPIRFTLENIVFIERWGNRIKDLAAYMQWYGEHVQKAIKKGKELVQKFVRRLRT